MGEIVMAIKATHVPSMLISEMPGENQGCRQAAIATLGQLVATQL